MAILLDDEVAAIERPQRVAVTVRHDGVGVNQVGL